MKNRKYDINVIILWILILLSLNGIISFAYSALKGNSPQTLWPLLSVNYLFISGMTQSGIIFSAVMRVVRSRWDCPFAKTGEIITLSTAPLCLILFVILYAGGTGHIYSKVSAPPSIFWRNILTMLIFYAISYFYYHSCALRESTVTDSGKTDKRLNILAFAVIFLYVIHNTITAWDLGMTIIPDWESTIFPPWFWVGSIFAGTAFIFIVRGIRMAGSGQLKGITDCDINKDKADTGWIICLDHMGKLILGFSLLWIYMFWSQYIVIWYGDIPRLTGPLQRQMSGNYRGMFLLMIIITFIIPFISLIQRRIRTSAIALLTVSTLICIGIWINRYLMILPLYSNDGIHIILSYTVISLILAILSASVLLIKYSGICFLMR